MAEGEVGYMVPVAVWIAVCKGMSMDNGLNSISGSADEDVVECGFPIGVQCHGRFGRTCPNEVVCMQSETACASWYYAVHTP